MKVLWSTFISNCQFIDGGNYLLDKLTDTLIYGPKHNYQTLVVIRTKMIAVVSTPQFSLNNVYSVKKT